MLEKYTEVEKPDFLKEVKPKQGNIIFVSGHLLSY